MSDSIKDYYSTIEAAKLLDVAVSTIQLWSNSGVLEAWKTAGGHRRITRASVDDILTKNHAVKYDTQQQEALSIVIVEDNKQQLRLYKKYLQNLSINTTLDVAEDGYLGLIKIGSILPDIIISDLVMPNMDGFKLIASLNSFAELDDSLRIVITGLTEEEVIEKGGLPDNVHLFTKPVVFSQLETLLNDKIESKKISNNKQPFISSGEEDA